MKLDDLPRFTIDEIQAEEEEGTALIVGRFSTLRGVRSRRGYLYRAHGASLVADLEAIPSTSEESARLRTPDAELAPELKRGTSYPWLDGMWQPYHLTMVLSPSDRWRKRVFSAEPARFFLLDGVTGWQPVQADLPDGATDLGVRAADWNREQCELCPEPLEAARSSEGFVDGDGRWICAHCFERYVRHNDVSFVLEGESDEAESE